MMNLDEYTIAWVIALGMVAWAIYDLYTGVPEIIQNLKKIKRLKAKIKARGEAIE